MVTAIRVHRAQVRIVHQVAHTVTAIRVQVPVQVKVVHTETEIPGRHHVLALPVQVKVVHMVTAIRVHLPIVPAEVIHTVAIVQKLVMIVAIARLRATANAVSVQIAPVAGLLMTAKSVHVVALAKSA